MGDPVEVVFPTNYGSEELLALFAKSMMDIMSQNKSRIMDVFRKFDANQDGRISRKEFRQGVKATGLKMTPAQVEALLDSLDADHDNNIDFAEFSKKIKYRHRQSKYGTTHRDESKATHSNTDTNLNGETPTSATLSRSGSVKEREAYRHQLEQQQQQDLFANVRMKHGSAKIAAAAESPEHKAEALQAVKYHEQQIQLVKKGNDILSNATEEELENSLKKRQDMLKGLEKMRDAATEGWPIDSNVLQQIEDTEQEIGYLQGRLKELRGESSDVDEVDEEDIPQYSDDFESEPEELDNLPALDKLLELTPEAPRYQEHHPTWASVPNPALGSMAYQTDSPRDQLSQLQQQEPSEDTMRALFQLAQSLLDKQEDTDTEIARLKHHIEVQQERELDLASNELTSLHERYAELLAILNTKETLSMAELHEHNEEVRKLSEHIASLREKELDLASNEMTEFHQMWDVFMESQQMRIQALLTKTTEQSNTIDKYEEELLTLRTQYVEERRSNDELRSESSVLRTEVTTLYHKYEHAVDNSKELEDIIAQLKKQLMESEAARLQEQQNHERSLLALKQELRDVMNLADSSDEALKTIQQQAAENAELHSKNMEATKERVMAIQREANAHNEAQLTSLQEQLADAQRNRADLQSQCESLEAQLQQLQEVSSAKPSNETVDILRQQLLQQESDLQRARQEHETSKQAHEDLQERFAQAVRSFEQEKDDLIQQGEASLSAAQAAAQRAQHMSEEADQQLNKVIDDHESKTAELNSRLKERNNEVARLNSMVSQLEMALQAAGEGEAKTSNDKQALLDEYIERNNAQAAFIEALKRERDAIKGEINEAKQSAAEEISRLNHRIVEQLAEMADLRDSIKARDEEIGKLKYEMASLNRQLEDLAQELESANEARSRQEGIAEQYQTQLEQASMDIKRHQSTIQELKQAAESDSSKVEESNDSQRHMQGTIEEQADLIMVKEQNEEKLMEEVEKLTKEVKDLKSDIDYRRNNARVFVAKHTFDPSTLSANEDKYYELSFTEGSLLFLFGEMDGDGFYEGECFGRRGLVPSNYVEEVPDTLLHLLTAETRLKTMHAAFESHKSREQDMRKELARLRGAELQQAESTTRLQREIADLHVANDHSETRVREANSFIQQLQKHLKQLVEDFAEVVEDNNSIKNQIEAQQRQLQAMSNHTGRSSQLQEELDLAQELRDEAVNNLSEAEVQIGTLQSQLEERTSQYQSNLKTKDQQKAKALRDLATANGKLQYAEEQLDRLRLQAVKNESERLQNAETEVDRLKEHIKFLEKSLQTTKDSNQKTTDLLESERRQSTRESNQLRQHITELQESLDEAQREKKKAVDQLGQEMASQQETSRRASLEQINSLNAELAQMRDAQVDLMEKLNAANHRVQVLSALEPKSKDHEQQISSLEGRLKEKEAFIQMLQQSQATLVPSEDKSAEMLILNNTLQDKQSVIDHLEATKKQLEVKMKTLYEENQALHLKAGELNSNYLVVNARLKESTAQLQRMDADQARYQSEIEEHLKRIAELHNQQHNNPTPQEVSMLKTQLAEASARETKLRQALTDREQEIQNDISAMESAAQRTRMMLESQNAQLQSQIASQKSALNEATSMLNNHNSLKKAFQESVENAEQLMNDLESKHKEVLALKEALDSVESQKTANTEVFKSTLKQLQEQNRLLTEENSSIRQDTSTTEELRAKLTAQLEMFQQQIAEAETLEATLKHLQSTNQALELDNQSLKQQLNMAQNSAANNEHRVAALQESVEQYQHDIKIYSTANENLQAEISQLRTIHQADMDRATQELHRTAEMNKSLEAELIRIQESKTDQEARAQQAARVESQFNEAIANNNQLASQNERLQEHTASQAQEIAQLQQKIHSLDDQVQAYERDAMGNSDTMKRHQQQLQQYSDHIDKLRDENTSLATNAAAELRSNQNLHRLISLQNNLLLVDRQQDSADSIDVLSAPAVNDIPELLQETKTSRAAVQTVIDRLIRLLGENPVVDPRESLYDDERREAQATIDHLQQQNQNLRQDNEMLQWQRDQLQQEYQEELRKQQDANQRDRQVATGDNQLYHRQYLQLADECNHLRQQLWEATQQQQQQSSNSRSAPDVTQQKLLEDLIATAHIQAQVIEEIISSTNKLDTKQLQSELDGAANRAEKIQSLLTTARTPSKLLSTTVRSITETTTTPHDVLVLEQQLRDEQLRNKELYSRIQALEQAYEEVQHANLQSETVVDERIRAAEERNRTLQELLHAKEISSSGSRRFSTSSESSASRHHLKDVQDELLSLVGKHLQYIAAHQHLFRQRTLIGDTFWSESAALSNSLRELGNDLEAIKRYLPMSSNGRDHHTHSSTRNTEMNRFITENEKLANENMRLNNLVQDLSRRYSDVSTNSQLYDRARDYHLRYLRADGFRKALVYQKKYLLLLLGGFQDSEDMTLATISRPSRRDQKYLTQSPLARFRRAVLAVIAAQRLKTLVSKWQAATASNPRNNATNHQNHYHHQEQQPLMAKRVLGHGMPGTYAQNGYA